jgi:hypothetical protein
MKQREDGEMNCEEFQRVLPQIIESGGDQDQEAHLDSCQACSELVRDLKYIAEQAKLLLPMHDPNPRVWNNIQDSLAREGLVSEGRISFLGSATTAGSKKKSWTPLGIALAMLAVLTLAELLVNYHPATPMSRETTAPSAGPDDSSVNSDDEALIRQVSQQRPDVRRAYETSLKEINSYIDDAKQAAADNPDDPSARAQLDNAYAQKAMLYDMGTGRALE